MYIDSKAFSDKTLRLNQMGNRRFKEKMLMVKTNVKKNYWQTQGPDQALDPANVTTPDDTNEEMEPPNRAVLAVITALWYEVAVIKDDISKNHPDGLYRVQRRAGHNQKNSYKRPLLLLSQLRSKILKPPPPPSRSIQMMLPHFNTKSLTWPLKWRN